MTGFSAVAFILTMTLIPLAAFVTYGVLVQKGTLPVPRQKFRELIAAGEAEAAWHSHVLFGMKMGFWPLGYAAFLLGTLVFAADPISSIYGTAQSAPPILIAIAFAAFQFGFGVRELSRGWEKAKTGMIGRSVYKMIDTHQAAQTHTYQGAEK